LSSNFRIAETHTFQKKIESSNFKRYYARIRDIIYPVLRSNPFFSPNVKKLKGEFEPLYRYRIGNYRLFYMVDDKKKLVFIMDIAHRKDAYR